MSLTASRTASMTIGGKSFSSNKDVTADAAIVHEEVLPKAEPAVLTTRSTDTTGDITADNSGHVIVTGQRVDLYWTEGGVNGERRGVTVGTVAGAVIPITGGAGDVLPTATTVINVAPSVEFDIGSVDGDEVKAIAAFIGSANRGMFVLEDAGGEELFRPIGSNQSYHYVEGVGEDNPIAADIITKGYLSHNDTAVTATARIGLVHNNA